MRETIGELRGSLQPFSPTPKLSLFRRIEKWAWAAPAWALVAIVFENMIALSLRTKLFGNETIRKVYESIARHARQVATFGRPLSDELKEKVKLLKAQNFSPNLIRDGILGRIFLSDGSTDLRPRRYSLLWVLGSIWHLVSLVSVSCLIILTMTLPGPVLVKAACAVVLFVYLVLSIAFMNAITQRTNTAFKRILSMSTPVNRAATLRPAR